MDEWKFLRKNSHVPPMNFYSQDMFYSGFVFDLSCYDRKKRKIMKKFVFNTGTLKLWCFSGFSSVSNVVAVANINIPFLSPRLEYKIIFKVFSPGKQ